MIGHATVRQIGRFVVAGAVNTGLTYALYLLLLQALPYAISYTIAFLLGIGLSYAINRQFVFRVNGSVGTMFAFPLVYVVQYAVSIVVVAAWVEALGDKVFAPLAGVAAALPVTYLLSRRIFLGRSAGAPR